MEDKSSQRIADVNHHSLFREDSLGRWTPRSIFIDLDRDSIDELLMSDVGQLIEPSQCNFSNGSSISYAEAKERFKEELEGWDLLRREMEQCDRVEDVLSASSQYGSSGSACSYETF